MEKLNCTFCKKSQDEVAQLIVAGPEQAICDECVGYMVGFIAEKNKEWRDRQIEALTKLNER
jgi:ATP-dependent protease Clp ATPase subunit